MNNDKFSFLEIYLSPRKGWEKLSKKRFTIPELYFKYIIFFAFIPIIGHALGMTIFKDMYLPNELIEFLKKDPNAQTQLTFVLKLKEIIDNGDIGKEIIILAIYYILELVRPAIYTALVFFLGGSFGGEKNPEKAFTIATFSLIPFWISGIIYFINNSNINAIFMFLSTFYMYYLTYVGAETLLKIPKENSKSFQFIIIFVILYTIISITLGAFIQNILYHIIV